MSNVVDPTLTRRVDLGGEEWADLRRELSGWEISRYTNADDEQTADVTAKYIVAWNVTTPDGQPLPIEGASLLVLKAPALSAIVDGLATSIAESVTPLPNASGARSQGTSRASASRTRTTRPRR